MGLIEQKNFRTHKTAVDYLRRGNDHWWDQGSDEIAWVFRGQWNANWLLTPTAWREAKYLDKSFRKLRGRVSELKSEYSHKDDPDSLFGHDNVAQLFTEIEAIGQFAEMADTHGFQVPTIPEKFRPFKAGNLGTGHIFHDGFPSELRAAGAIAQHHGVPTQFLDWTDVPLVAAYFATGYQFRSEDDASDCAVFALHKRNMERLCELSRKECRYCSRVEAFRGSHAASDYQRSQGGLFLEIDAPWQFRKQHGRWPDLESVINIMCERPPSDRVVLRKITFPSAVADDVLTRIDREGVNLARLMPTLDNVAATVKSRWRAMP